jgi:hypothetical protein
MDCLEVLGYTLSSADEWELLGHILEFSDCLADIWLQLVVLLHDGLIVIMVVVDIFVELLCAAIGVFDALSDHDYAARTNGSLVVLASEGYLRTPLA